MILIYVQTKHKSKNNFNAVTLKSVKKLKEIGNVSVSVSTGLRETNLDVFRNRSPGNSRKGKMEEHTFSCAYSVASHTHCFSFCLCTPAGVDF